MLATNCALCQGLVCWRCFELVQVLLLLQLWLRTPLGLPHLQGDEEDEAGEEEEDEVPKEMGEAGEEDGVAGEVVADRSNVGQTSNIECGTDRR